MSRNEHTFWTLAILAAPWAAYYGGVALLGEQSGNGPMQLTMVSSIVAVWLAMRGTLPWHLAWASRAPLLALRVRWANNRWKWTYAIAPEPERHGAYDIWVSRALSPDEKSAVGRVTEALAVLAVIQPSRAARLERLGVQLAVMPVPGYAAYVSGINVLAIDPRALAESAEVLASIIVHESNHALMASRGLMHPLLEARNERLARIDSWIFARRLHQSGKVEDVRRIAALVTGAARADYGLRAHLIETVAATARVQRGLDRKGDS